MDLDDLHMVDFFFSETQNFAFVATFDMLIDRRYMPVNR